MSPGLVIFFSGWGEMEPNLAVAWICLTLHFVFFYLTDAGVDWAVLVTSSSGEMSIFAQNTSFFQSPLVSPLSATTLFGFYRFSAPAFTLTKNISCLGFLHLPGYYSLLPFLLFDCLLLCIFRFTESFSSVFCLLLLHFCLQGKAAGQLLGQNMRGPAPFFQHNSYSQNALVSPPQKKIAQMSFSSCWFFIFKLFFLDHISLHLNSSSHILTWLHQTFLSDSIKCFLGEGSFVQRVFIPILNQFD